MVSESKLLSLDLTPGVKVGFVLLFAFPIKLFCSNVFQICTENNKYEILTFVKFTTVKSDTDVWYEVRNVENKSSKFVWKYQQQIRVENNFTKFYNK